jgi:hypothetical protein
MINCIDLNLQTNPLREGLDINSFGTASHTKISLTDINPDLISFLATLKITIAWAELFYTEPFAFTGIHIDNFGGDYTKLNYIFGGRNSYMCWWKPKLNAPMNRCKTIVDTNYIGFKPEEVDLIDQQPVKFPSIVQVGIPHNIQNFEEPRYCLSLVLLNSTRLTMAKSIELFKQYL